MSPQEVVIAQEPFGQTEDATTEKYEGARLVRISHVL